MDLNNPPLFGEYRHQFSEFFDADFLSRLRLFLFDDYHLSIDHVIKMGWEYGLFINDKWIYDERADNLIMALNTIGVHTFYVAEMDCVRTKEDFGIVPVTVCLDHIEELQHPFAVTDHWDTIWFAKSLDFVIIHPSTSQTPLYYAGSRQFVEIATTSHPRM